MIQNFKQKITNKKGVYLVAFAVLLALTAVTSAPIRKSKAASYLEQGDAFLAQNRYISAIVEYRKAQYLNKSKVDTASDRIKLAKEAQKNILSLESFYREKNDIKILNDINRAKSVPRSEYNLVILAKNFIEEDKPQLAIVATKTAVEMNRRYRDAWLYLGISHISTMSNVELEEENRHYHLDQAREALAKAQELDPSYQPTKEYLQKLPGQN